MSCSALQTPTSEPTDYDTSGGFPEALPRAVPSLASDPLSQTTAADNVPVEIIKAVVKEALESEPTDDTAGGFPEALPWAVPSLPPYPLIQTTAADNVPVETIKAVVKEALENAWGGDCRIAAGGVEPELSLDDVTDSLQLVIKAYCCRN